MATGSVVLHSDVLEKGLAQGVGVKWTPVFRPSEKSRSRGDARPIAGGLHNDPRAK